MIPIVFNRYFRRLTYVYLTVGFFVNHVISVAEFGCYATCFSHILWGNLVLTSATPPRKT